MPGRQRRATVGRVLAVTGDRKREQRSEDVESQSDEHLEGPDQIFAPVAFTLREVSSAEAPPAEPGADCRKETRGGYDHGVAIRDMSELMPEDGLHFTWLETLEKPSRDDDGRTRLPNPCGKRIGHVSLVRPSSSREGF